MDGPPLGPFELPQEVNPLTAETLFKVLQDAASSQQQQIHTGTKQLRNWELYGGYFPLLQSVFLDKSLPLEVRYLAIIQLKNGVDKYWRKVNLDTAIPKYDKDLVRSELLPSGISEADTRLALQNALVIAKIIRLEYPKDWPDAITTLIECVRAAAAPGANPLHLSRAMLILLHITKEFASGRLQRIRANLLSITPELFHVLGSVYTDMVQRWWTFLQHGGDDEGGALQALEQSLLAIKVLRRLMISGFEFANRNKDFREFWALIRNQLGEFLGVVSQQPSPLAKEVRRLIENHLVQFSKLHLEMATVHQTSFSMLPDSVGLVRAYWSFVLEFSKTFASMPAVDPDIDDKAPLVERLSLKGLLLVRACVKLIHSPTPIFKYRHEQEKEEQKQAIELMKTKLFTKPLVQEMMETAVTQFFEFRNSDMIEWKEDPEEWEQKMESEGSGWEFSIRPCAEKLFLDLVIYNKDTLVQPLVEVFSSVTANNSTNIVLKDSVYTAIGLAASAIRPFLEFDIFLSNTLVNEVQVQDPSYQILRRRIPILLGQWVSVKISKENRPLVYEIFQFLLNDSDPLNDLVVRITAGRHFKHVVDEWEFEAQAFLPYAPSILKALMKLIQEVETSETKMALLNTISVIVERFGHHIIPYADEIVNLLPSLWDQSGEEHLLKQAILTILSRLINAMKAESLRFHGLVLPLIKNAVEPGSETQVYLLEDAMELWGAIVVQSVRPVSNDLLALAAYLIPTFELGTESVRKALEIAESYILLAPEHMMDNPLRSQLFTTFTEMLGTLRPDANGIIANLIGVLIRSAEALGGQQAVQVVYGTLLETGFLEKSLAGLHESWEVHQKTGPHDKYPKVDGLIETDYFAVLARLALCNPDYFISAVDNVAKTRSESFDQLINWLLTEWFSHFENVGSPDKRKLMCLALTRLIEGGHSWILGRLQELMTLWTDVVSELQEGATDRGGEYDSLKSINDERYSNGLYSSLVYWNADELKPQGEPESPEDERRRELIFSDPVHTINITSFLREQLSHLIQKCGGQEVFQETWLVHVDRDVIAAFGKLGIM